MRYLVMRALGAARLDDKHCENIMLHMLPRRLSLLWTRKTREKSATERQGDDAQQERGRVAG